MDISEITVSFDSVKEISEILIQWTQWSACEVFSLLSLFKAKAFISPNDSKATENTKDCWKDLHSNRYYKICVAYTCKGKIKQVFKERKKIYKRTQIQRGLRVHSEHKTDHRHLSEQLSPNAIFQQTEMARIPTNRT